MTKLTKRCDLVFKYVSVSDMAKTSTAVVISFSVILESNFPCHCKIKLQLSAGRYSMVQAINLDVKDWNDVLADPKSITFSMSLAPSFFKHRLLAVNRINGRWMVWHYSTALKRKKRTMFTKWLKNSIPDIRYLFYTHVFLSNFNLTFACI